MTYTAHCTLPSTPSKNFAESGKKNNGSLPPKSHTRSRNESGRDGRNSKAFPNGTSLMEMQEAKEISDVMSRSQDKGKDERREKPSSLYESPHLMDNDAIPDTPRHQTEDFGTNGSETSRSLPWTPSPSAILTPRQRSAPWISRSSSTPWSLRQTAPDLAGGSARNFPSLQPLVVYSKDFIIVGEMIYVTSSASKFLEATPTNDTETAKEESWKLMHKRLWPAYNYLVPPVQGSTSTNPFVSSPRYSLRHNPISSPPRYHLHYERRESPSERYRRTYSRHEPSFSHRPESMKRSPRYTSERPYSWFSRFNWMKERWEPRKYVPKETEDVQFQYQDPPQFLSKPQDSGTNSRRRILARRRKKRGSGKETQHSPLDSSLDLSDSAEKRSREDESPSWTEPQLVGRHDLSDWKLRNGKSKDWRRKPSTKTLTARQFLTAIYSHKQLHFSTFHAQDSEMARFEPNIPVAAQRSRRGKSLMVVKKESPAFLLWLDRKGYTDMGVRRDHMREIFDEEEFEVEAHRKSGFRPEVPAETNWDMDACERQHQFLQACPSAKISQDANPPHCLQIQYIGRVIPSPYGCFQLSEHIESSAYAEVYKICYLHTSHESFARIYALRGIHPNQRKRRVENLKRFSQLNKLLPAFDWQGKKVCVFSTQYKAEYISLFEEDSTPKADGIGAIGRKKTKEYDAAFPPLPSSPPIPGPKKVPFEATEPLTPEQQFHLKTLKVIKSEIEDTSPKRWKSISKEPLPLAQRLMIRLMDLNGISMAKQNSERKVRDCGVHLENKGNRKWNEDGKGKDLEVKIKKKRWRKKKSEKGVVV